MVALTSDHTPDRKDELERILAAGGHVYSSTKGAHLSLIFSIFSTDVRSD